MRLDIYLTKHFDIQSRNKSTELIKDKKVKVNNEIITKSSFKVQSTMTIEIIEDEFYVSRSAKKLKYFLEEISIKLENKNCLDIGSSTGGFTQVLLEHNVKNIICVDVGSNQLHDSIKNNKKIIKKENTDIREFKSEHKFEVITCDVSFISMLNIMSNINNLASEDIIILFKPQFEVGSNVKRNQAGVVMDNKAIKIARDKFLKESTILQWHLVYCNVSKVHGKNGNIEELFYFKKNK